MFNDRYGLTEAVLEGRKTQTRRVISINFYNRVDWKYFEEGHNDCIIDDDISILDCGHYHVGEVVAIAQRYKDIQELLPQDPIALNTLDGKDDFVYTDYTKMMGWNNKMFVKAKLMPHHIKITNIRVERLQDISDEDCLREGVVRCAIPFCLKDYCTRGCDDCADSPREAYAILIDKVSGKGTWDKNPWVFVYDFELVD